MYDAFSFDYDRFVNWNARLAAELPFLEGLLKPLTQDFSVQSGQAPHQQVKVLDAACGTGMHAIALAQRGYQAAGADLSTGMIEQARRNAQAAGVQVRFEAKGFGNLAETFGPAAFKAVLCLGNSLPHVLDEGGLATALQDFHACLKPGGLVVIQNRNFDNVMAQQVRWMEPQSHRKNEAEWVFLRFYDFEPGGLIQFNIVTLKRESGSAWSQQVTSTRLRPWLQEEMLQAMRAAGFGEAACYGSMRGELFDAANSGNLVITARR